MLLVGVEVVVGSHYDWRWWGEPSGCREENVGGALYGGRRLSWTSGFETTTMKRGEAKGFFQKGGAGAKREIEVNWNIYGRGW